MLSPVPRKWCVEDLSIYLVHMWQIVAHSLHPLQFYGSENRHIHVVCANHTHTKYSKAKNKQQQQQNVRSFAWKIRWPLTHYIVLSSVDMECLLCTDLFGYRNLFVFWFCPQQFFFAHSACLLVQFFYSQLIWLEKGIVPDCRKPTHRWHCYRFITYQRFVFR